MNISDAIVLVAATAAAMAATRHRWVDHYELLKPGGEAYQLPFPNVMYTIRELLFSISFFVAAWSLAVLWIGLRHPRPRCRAITRQPGMTAVLAAVVALAIQLANLALAISVKVAWYGEWDPFSDRGWISVWLESGYLEEPPMIPSIVGCAVAATWIVQAASGRWKPKPNGIDRMGRALGWFWIATIPISWFSWNV